MLILVAPLVFRSDSVSFPAPRFLLRMEICRCANFKMCGVFACKGKGQPVAMLSWDDSHIRLRHSPLLPSPM